jgi:hypothetical protein
MAQNTCDNKLKLISRAKTLEHKFRDPTTVEDLEEFFRKLQGVEGLVDFKESDSELQELQKLIDLVQSNCK